MVLTAVLSASPMFMFSPLFFKSFCAPVAFKKRKAGTTKPKFRKKKKPRQGDDDDDDDS